MSIEADRSLGLAERLGFMVKNAKIEIIPSDKILGKIDQISKDSELSVTASPTKPIEETLELSAKLREKGFQVIPHIAARRIKNTEHLRGISRFLEDQNIEEVFVIGGDGDPWGNYSYSSKILEDLFSMNHSIKRVGVGGYPEGHPLIDNATLFDHLRAKVAIASAHNIEIHINSQACYDPEAIANWIKTLHEIRLNVPIILGISAPIDIFKLAQTSKEIGVGDSIAFLKMVGIDSALKSATYNPNDLLNVLARKTEFGHIKGIHLFTFNHIKASMEWQKNFQN